MFETTLVFELVIGIAARPGGAGADNVILPATLAPPYKALGVTENEVMVMGAMSVTVAAVLVFTPLLAANEKMSAPWKLAFGT